MTTTKVLSGAALCLLATACADSIPVEPTSGLSAVQARASVTAAEPTAVDAALATLGAQLGLPENVQIVSAEIMRDMEALKDHQPTLIIANDRIRGTGVEWVPGDPRRGGRVGVNWSVVGFGGLPSRMFDATVPGFLRPATLAETLDPIVAGMNDWATRSCMRAPVERTTNNNVNADIIHGLWMPGSFFTDNWGPAGASILGVTLSSAWLTGPGGDFSDIDGNGELDYAQAIILYNNSKVWSNDGPLGTTDLYSVITHEAGHAFGLNHFGKVFVNGKDIQPNGSIFVDDIKYAPKALMNAVYVMGRGSIAGTDHSSFCQIWGSVN